MIPRMSVHLSPFSQRLNVQTPRAWMRRPLLPPAGAGMSLGSKLRATRPSVGHQEFMMKFRTIRTRGGRKPHLLGQQVMRGSIGLELDPYPLSKFCPFVIANFLTRATDGNENLHCSLLSAFQQQPCCS